MNKHIFLFLLVGLFMISFVSADTYNDTIAHGQTTDTTTNANTISGMVINTSVNGAKLVRIDKLALDGSTAFAIRTSPGGENLSVTKTCGAYACEFATPFTMTKGTNYYILSNQSGATWDIRYQNAPQGYPTPAGLNGSFVTGYNLGFGWNELNRTVSIANFTLTYSENVLATSTLNSLKNGDSTSNVSILFNSSQTAENGLLNNATIYIYRANGTIFNITSQVVNGTSNESIFNITGFTAGNYLWDVYVCSTGATGQSCVVSGNNRTFNWGTTLNSNTYSNPVLELTTQPFILNLTIASGLSSAQATLVYNNTRYIATSITSGTNTIFTRNVIAPDVSANTNIAWQWQLQLDDSSGTIYLNITNGTQTVQTLSVDDCGTNTLRILNYTLRDEDADTIIYPTGTTINATIEVQATFSNPTDPTIYSIYNHSYTNKTNALVCLQAGALTNSSYTLDVITKYESSTRVSEFHNIQKYSLTNLTANQNISLYDLTTATSQLFLITFKDENFLPVSGALIDITRHYISQGVFKSVEVPKTDSSGQAVGHFVLSDALYTLIVSKNGVVLGTFNNVQAKCDNQAIGDCKINLNALGTGIPPEDFDEINNIVYNMVFSKASRTVTTTFSTLDGSSATVSLNTTKFDNYGNTTVCGNTLTTSSGTLSCVIPSSFGNSTVISTLYVNGNEVGHGVYSLRQSAESTFGSSRFFLMLLIVVTLPLMALASWMGTIIFVILGVALVSLLNIIEGGIFGIGATIFWLIIAGGIIWWKASQTR